MMNTQRSTESSTSDALTEVDLSLIVGGSVDPNDPVGGATGAAEVDLKATPILM
jgi:hypothetical protein